jgi:hypothetical protein
MEKAIIATLGFNAETSTLLIILSGIGEIFFGLAILIFYRNVNLIKLNILALTGLLFYVALFIPQYLTEAFNPVTTNIPLIIISMGLISELKRIDDK